MRGDELAHSLADLEAPICRERDGADVDVFIQRVEAKLERGDDPEVCARPAHAPEQVGVLVLARVYPLPVAIDEVNPQEVVDGEPEPAHQSSHAAAERQAADARVPDDSDGADQAVRLGGRIELREVGASLHERAPAGRIDLHLSHPRKVDDHPAIARRETGDAVPAAPHRDRQAALACVPDRRHDVVNGRAAGDHRRAAVGDRVPHRARLVVLRVVRADDLAREAWAELRDHHSEPA